MKQTNRRVKYGGNSTLISVDRCHDQLKPPASTVLDQTESLFYGLQADIVHFLVEINSID